MYTKNGTTKINFQRVMLVITAGCIVFIYSIIIVVGSYEELQNFSKYFIHYRKVFIPYNIFVVFYQSSYN